MTTKMAAGLPGCAKSLPATGPGYLINGTTTLYLR